MVTYTANKNLQIPAYASTSWNTPVDIDWNLLDQIGGSPYPISVGTGGTTALLYNTAANASGVYWYSAQQFTITATSTLTSNATITLPQNLVGSGITTMGGAWIVVNGITTAQSQTALSITVFPTSGNSSFTLGTTAPIAGTIVVLSSTGALPGGFSAGVEYFVVNPVGSTCDLSATYGGSAILATSTSPYLGTSTMTARYVLRVQKTGGAANSGVIIQPETKGYIYFNGTTVNFADDNIIKKISSIDGALSISGPLTTASTITTSDTVTLSATNTPDVKLTNIIEDGTYGSTTWASTFNYDVLTQSVWYNTASATSTFTLNIRGNSNVALSSVIPNTGDLVTCVYIVDCPAAVTLSLPTSSCTGTTLTTTGSPALTVGTTITSAGSVSLGTIVSGSANTWIVSVGGTYTSQTMTATFVVPYCSAVQIDGTATGVTTIWQGGVAPTSGIASQKNSYTFTVLRTGASTYTVLASVVGFA